MECGAVNFGARAGTTVFLSYFKHPQNRRQLGKAVYPLEEILLLRMFAVLAGAESFVDIARVGEKKRDLLRRSRACRRAPFQGRTPSRDPLGVATLDSEALRRCFVAWLAAPTKTPAEIVAIVLRFRSG